MQRTSWSKEERRWDGDRRREGERMREGWTSMEETRGSNGDQYPQEKNEERGVAVREEETEATETSEIREKETALAGATTKSSMRLYEQKEGIAIKIGKEIEKCKIETQGGRCMMETVQETETTSAMRAERKSERGKENENENENEKAKEKEKGTEKEKETETETEKETAKETETETFTCKRIQI